MMRNAALAQTSRARSIAAANNQCRALVPADMFPKMSPEFKIAYEGLQGAQADACRHCGNAIPLQAFAGCGAHPMCEMCIQNPDIKVRKPNGCCTIRGCNLPVPEQCIPLIALTEARAKAAECLHKMVFALQREEMRDPAPAPAASAAPVVEADDEDDDDDDDVVNSNGKRGKRGKMSDAKKADMLTKRRKTMSDKKEALDAELAVGKKAVADLAEAQTEIAQLKSHVEMLQAALRLAEAPAPSQDGIDSGELIDEALDAVMELAIDPSASK